MPKLSKRATLIKDYESIAASQAVKAYVCFCFDNEDSFEDEIDYCMYAELAVLKSSKYLFHGQWDSNWEQLLHDGMYMTMMSSCPTFIWIDHVSCN